MEKGGTVCPALGRFNIGASSLTSFHSSLPGRSRKILRRIKTDIFALISRHGKMFVGCQSRRKNAGELKLIFTFQFATQQTLISLPAPIAPV